MICCGVRKNTTKVIKWVISPIKVLTFLTPLFIFKLHWVFI